MMCPLASAAVITVLRGGAARAAMEKGERVAGVAYIIEASSAHFPSEMEAVSKLTILRNKSVFLSRTSD